MTYTNQKNEVIKKMVAHKQLNLFGGPVLTHKIRFKNQVQTMEKSKKSESTIFKALQRETSVYKYYVELKEDALTEQGFFDLLKVPDLFITGAGQFLKCLRKKNSLRQKDIAKTVGLTRGSVNQWENYNTRIALKSLVKIVETLGVSRDTIYSLLDQGTFSLRRVTLPLKFERIRNIVQYFNPFKDDNKGQITLLKCCSDEMLSKIRVILNVKPMTYGNRRLIHSRELYNFLTTFFRYSKVPKIHLPLTTDVKDWYDNGIDLKRAVILPCLQSDGNMDQFRPYYMPRFSGKSRNLHNYFVDAMYYEYHVLPSSYYTYDSGVYCTKYARRSINEISGELINLAGNIKTSPAHKQTVADYLKEPQPHLNCLMNVSGTEQLIALRMWATTEGSISITKNNRHAYPRLKIACAHPELTKGLQQIARRFNINFAITRSKSTWSGIHALSVNTLSSCINFLKLGGFIKGVKIGATSSYHEGIDKDILLLGILEFKKRELEDNRLKKLPIQQIHFKINKIVENRGYKSADHYINYFS